MARGKNYVVEIDFEKAFNDLSQEKRAEIVADNIGLLNDCELITELEVRGYEIV